MSNHFVPVPAPGENMAPSIAPEDRGVTFVPAPAAPAAVVSEPDTVEATSAPAVPAAAAAPSRGGRAPKPPRQPHPTDRAEQQKAIAALCQDLGITPPLGRFSPERAALRAQRAAMLGPATMTQAEADARGITEQGALRRLGLLP